MRAAAKVAPEPTSNGKLLVVDDDVFVTASFSRILSAAGHQVETANGARLALEKIATNDFDAVISDISMPEMDGMQLLERLKNEHADLPVVIVTGRPTIQTAIDALEHGAARYLKKPVDATSLRNAVSHALNLRRLARIKREAQVILGSRSEQEQRRRAELEETFEAGLRDLWVAYQPVVSCKRSSVIGYEALLRTRNPALPSPLAFLEVAERVGRLDDIGRKMREAAPEPFVARTDGLLLFVNLHPRDLLDDALFEADTALGKMAHAVVLEITERAALEQLDDAAGRTARLRELGYSIAIDDVGAGYAGLSSIALLEPEVIKLDMSLIRDIDRRPTQQRLVRSMVDVASDLRALLIVEGIETDSELDTLVDLGCDLMQGYRFARPGPAFPQVGMPATRRLDETLARA